MITAVIFDMDGVIKIQNTILMSKQTSSILKRAGDVEVDLWPSVLSSSGTTHEYMWIEMKKRI